MCIDIEMDIVRTHRPELNTEFLCDELIPDARDRESGRDFDRRSSTLPCTE
jgi:hypothetical protein